MSDRQSTPASSFRVLVVEDDTILAMGVEQIVASLGHTAFVCARGEDAVETARELGPELVLMDVSLGGTMSGIEAATIIKAELGCPIIFMTGYNDEPYTTRMRQISGAAVLSKPLDEPRLRHFMRKRIEF